MSYKELKEQLGWDLDLSCTIFTPPVSSKRKNNTPKHKKRLSFLSDSQYLTSPPSDCELDDACVHSDSESHSDSSPTLSCSSSSTISASLTDSQTGSDQDIAFFGGSPRFGVDTFSPSTCSSESLAINPNGSGFPQPLFSCADEDDEEEEGERGDCCLSLSSFPPSSRLSTSSATSFLNEPTTMGQPLCQMEEESRIEDISCSTTSGISLASGSNSAMLSTLLDEDSCSIMDTLPPHPSNSQNNELASFVSSLPLPTPSFSGALDRDAENTPFEFDSLSNHTMAGAVKQNLHFGSCDPKADAHYRQNSRGPLQPVENIIGERFNRKDGRPLAKGNRRAKSFFARDSNRQSTAMNRGNLDSN